MEFIVSESDNPCFNLALEEVLLTGSTKEFLMLSINSPSVIIGKHQCAFKELNPGFVYERKIPLIRRISGGGTVYHDHGNLNFAFMRNAEPGRQVDFRKHTLPVTEFLTASGVAASFEGKNDLRVNGLKISGNAEHVYRERVLHHGTLLFSSSLVDLREALRNNPGRYSTRAVNSNPSHVGNITGFTTKFRDIRHFRDDLLNFIMEKEKSDSLFVLPDDSRKRAESLADTKYGSWDWNHAYGPHYKFTNDAIVSGEKIHIEFAVDEGIINNVAAKGGRLAGQIQAMLEGCRHSPGDVREKLEALPSGISSEEVFEFF
ncbi:MAG: lipoate--protein ligase family protein [Bacteroidales bacterium]|jgi:lipoate-protein ligase A|nr:lipoate--protein ligase family protein [Bacteroidales bacterium]MCU0407485.1 lipoate--protein ligase family protein [Bacteroidales bacterium]